MKKILFANKSGLRPYHISGAEETMDEFLKHLASTGYLCFSINCKENYLFSKRSYNQINNNIEHIEDTYAKVFFNSVETYSQYVFDYIKDIKPDIIFTQLLGSLDIIRVANKLDIPVVLFLQSYDHELLLSETRIILNDYIGSISGIISISKFIHEALPDSAKAKSCVCYPIIKDSKYKYTGCKKESNILFINPIKIKGIDIIIQLIEHFKWEQFEVVENWYPVTKEYYNILNRYENVKITQHSKDVKPIYGSTKILLVPSLCSEGFGRIIIEANINGIPVIASNIGGIKEAAGQSQKLINDYKNIGSWISELHNVLIDMSWYEQLRLSALSNSMRFQHTNIIDVLGKFKL